jgi:hypothetical protein
MKEIILNKPENFANQFLKEYLNRGYGRLSKREMDILVLHLLFEDRQYDVNNPDFYKMSLELRITESRIKNLYKDVQLIYLEDDPEKSFKKKLIQLIQTQKFQINKRKIRLFIKDPLFRQSFENWIYKANSFVDYSFNRDILEIEIDVFIEVIESNIDQDENEVKKLIKQLPKGAPKELYEAKNTKEYLKILFSKFAEYSVKEIGTKVPNLFITILVNSINNLITGGF